MDFRSFIEDLQSGLTGSFAVLNEVAKNAAHTAITAIDTLLPFNVSDDLVPKVNDTFFPTYTVNVGADLEEPIKEVGTPIGVNRNLYDIEEISGPVVPKPTTPDNIGGFSSRSYTWSQGGRNVLSNNQINYHDYSDRSSNSYVNNVTNSYYNNISFAAEATRGKVESRFPYAANYGNFFADIQPVYQIIAYDEMWPSRTASSDGIRHSTKPQSLNLNDLIKGGYDYGGKRNKRSKKR